MKESKAIPGFAGLPLRLGGVVFLAIAPACGFLCFTGRWETGLLLGVLGPVAAGIAGEYLVRRRLRRLVAAADALASGDFSARTGLENVSGEIGGLARAFDSLARSLEQRVKKHEQTEQMLLNRALQQAAVAALGRLALTSPDFSSVAAQSVTLISQTLEVEFCRILEWVPGRQSLRMQAGLGWNQEAGSVPLTSADDGSQCGYVTRSGEPVTIANLRTEKRFTPDPILLEHRLTSGLCVPITGREGSQGVLDVYSPRERKFTGDDLQFLLAVANALASAASRFKAEADMKKLAEFAQLNPNPAVELAADGRITYFNQAALQLAKTVGFGHPGDDFVPREIRKVAESCLATGRSRTDLVLRMERRVLSWSLHPVTASQVVHCYVTDITDRLNLEAQLRQSQKMESIGQLAAGVAHDFNNMLTVIQGHAGMLMSRTNLPPQLRDSIQAICFATDHAASLTRHLLLFSRESVLQPQELDLREIVRNLAKMLRRLLGEAITFDFTPPSELPAVRADAAMIEQAIINLAVNARESMPAGGRLIISLRATEVDEAYVRLHPEARSGNFVCLCMIDTGRGMDADALSRAFEPSVITKETGKSANFGLATVYGIVKQHGGWIEVASEVGKGSAFAAFLPASAAGAKVSRPADALLAEVRGGSETILVVEDEASVRSMVSMILQDCGYRVFEAGTGQEALEVWQRQQGRVDLLLTDMVMPERMSGVELAQKLPTQGPGMKVIFSSGYDVSGADMEFIRKSGAAFLRKPYTRAALTTAIRESLDRP